MRSKVLVRGRRSRIDLIKTLKLFSDVSAMKNGSPVENCYIGVDDFQYSEILKGLSCGRYEFNVISCAKQKLEKNNCKAKSEAIINKRTSKVVKTKEVLIESES